MKLEHLGTTVVRMSGPERVGFSVRTTPRVSGP